MKKILIALALICAALSQASPIPFSLPRVAQDVLNETFFQLNSVGVIRLNPYDPALPYPQVSAIEALYQPRTGALAYFDQETEVGVVSYVFKNWQGGNRHRISFNEDHISFVTPYLGTVAHANRFKVVQGWRYDFYCRSQFVTKMEWDYCIRENFISVLRNQLTR